MHFCFVPLCEQVVTVNDKSQPLRWTARDEARNPEHKAGEVKRDGKGTVRYKRVVATDEAGNPIVKKTIAQTKIFDRKAMRDFHPQLTEHMRKHFGFDVGVELEDKGDKLLSKLGHDEYVAAKATLAKTEAEVRRIQDKRDEIRKLASEESERLEHLQGARDVAQERVAVLETVAAAVNAADAAPVSEKRGLLGRVAAVCARCAERLGLAINKGVETAKKKLAIGVRHGGDADRGLHGRMGARREAGVQQVSVMQPQMEMGLTK